MSAPYQLFTHQADAVEFLLQNERVILADEMGIGKTLFAIHAARGRTIVICPASLKRNWYAEITRAVSGLCQTGDNSPSSVQIIDGRKPVEIIADWIIINFDILAYHANRLTSAKADTVIVDEEHELRNRRSKRFASAVKIAYSCERRYLLTGTPIYNRPADILALLQLLGKLNSDFGGFYEFVERYCSAHDTPFGLDYSGASNLDELHDLLHKKKIMMRRKKATVLALTEKTREIFRVTVDPAHLHSYEECEQELAPAIIQNPQLLEMKKFDFLSHIRQAVGVCKIEAATRGVLAKSEWSSKTKVRRCYGP